ncbi:MAG: hypothetical protein M1812_006190 [Candelaria pacifica]|nr:MAG: hypothetical protein M1812_006190 [Candelaria pacifica]
MAYYNNYGDPRLRQGMTTNQSPVYTYLQPDETGRRPTQWEILQFARPEEIPQSPHQADRRRNRSPRGAAQEATSSVSQDRSLRQANAPIAGARYATGLLSSGAHVRVISGGGDYTSSEGENTQPRSGRPPLDAEGPDAEIVLKK